MTKVQDMSVEQAAKYPQHTGSEGLYIVVLKEWLESTEWPKIYIARILESESQIEIQDALAITLDQLRGYYRSKEDAGDRMKEMYKEMQHYMPHLLHTFSRPKKDVRRMLSLEEKVE